MNLKKVRVCLRFLKNFSALNTGVLGGIYTSDYEVRYISAFLHSYHQLSTYQVQIIHSRTISEARSQTNAAQVRDQNKQKLSANCPPKLYV